MKSVESCEGRIVFRASRESRVNSREEKAKKKERKKRVGWKIFARMAKARTHDNKLKSFERNVRFFFFFF